MKLSTTTFFNKLWGRINFSLQADEYYLTIQNNYMVHDDKVFKVKHI